MKNLKKQRAKLRKTHDVLICSDTNAHTGTEQGCLNAVDDWGQPEVTVEGKGPIYRVPQCKGTSGINARGKPLTGILERGRLHILNGMVKPCRRGTNRGTMSLDSMSLDSTNTNYVMRLKNGASHHRECGGSFTRNSRPACEDGLETHICIGARACMRISTNRQRRRRGKNRRDKMARATEDQ